MIDCVSREAAIEELKHRHDYYSEAAFYTRLGLEIAISVMKSLPSVTPATPVAHWVDIDEEPHEEWECDHCGFVIDGSGCIDPIEYRDIYKYCPNCGRKMEGEQT